MKDHWGLGRRDREGKRNQLGSATAQGDVVWIMAVERRMDSRGTQGGNWQMQKMREVPRGHLRLLESVTLFQVGPPTELGDGRRAEVQETRGLQDLLGDAKLHSKSSFRGSRETSIHSGIGARCPTSLLNWVKTSLSRGNKT